MLSPRSRIRVLVILLACLAGTSAAVAQTPYSGLHPDISSEGPKQLSQAATEEVVSETTEESEGPRPQAVISADEIAYDDANAMVIASGNVEIAHGERILLAETVRYDQTNDSIVASGNVVLLEPSGEVIFADYVELSDEMRNGVMENIRVLMAGNARFAANGARRIDGRKTIMKKAVYSPCQVCEGEPEREPLWQLKAGTITHDQEKKNVYYTNAWLELYGLPVAYTPFLMHPDPSVERRTGLLTPRFGTSTVFGGYTRTPFFLAVTESVDMTIEPIVTTRERPILALEYRQRLNSGLIEISGSGTKGDREIGDPTAPTILEDENRGHLFGKGRFDISDHWRWGFDYRRASDPTYLDRYNFFGDPGDTLESNLFTEGFHRRTYTAFNIFGYQDLGLADPEKEPIVLPTLDHNLMSEADSIGGRWAFDANLRSHYRREGTDTRRLSLKGGYTIPFVADFGLVTTVSASLAADGYHMDQVDIDGVGVLENNVTAGRVVPRLAVEWRYPFVRGTDGYRTLVEPVAAVIAAPNNGNPSEIQAEDNVVVELDDTNLFSEDQIPGLDIADLGQRAAYGLKTGLYGEKGGRVTAFIGQSYRLENDDNRNLTSDLRGGPSDVVGRVEVAPNKYFDVLYRFRLTNRSYDMLRNEIAATVGPPAFRLTGDYIFIASEASDGLFPDRKEIKAELTSQLTDFWSAAYGTRRDLTSTGGTLEHAARITYEDECFRLDLKYRRDFTETIDVEKSTTVSLELVFKTLGNVAAEQQTSR